MESNQYRERMALPGKAESFWMASTPETDFPPLSGDVSVDVAVIGGGIAGLTAGILLKESGAKVAVIEARRILTGATGHTTAKLTSAHGVIYNDLIKKFGNEKARLYAGANQRAIEFVAEFVSRHAISCDFLRQKAASYTEKDGEISVIQKEFDAAKSLGLPVSLADTLPLPFKIKAAIVYDNQAHFHPRKYLLAVAGMIPGNGSYVFEETRVLDVKEGSPCRVETTRGVLRADRVIIATHFPIINTGFLFAKMSVERSYLMAVHLNGNVPDGMYYQIGDPYHTMRSHTTDAGDKFLLIGGQNHLAGLGGSTIAHYREVAEYARGRFDIKSFDYHWSAQDNWTADGVPFIGRLGGSPIYVATGFRGWGMSNGTAAGILLSDLISGRENPWAILYNPNRIASLISKEFITQGFRFTRTFIAERLPVSGGEKPVKELGQGEGSIAEKDREKVAAFRDTGGKLYTVSPVCRHMGCIVSWNDAEATWDCPCHGSRYDSEGQVIHSPAVRDLPAK